MSVHSRLLVLVTVSVLLLACDDGPTSPGDGPVAFRTVTSNATSGFSTPWRDVFRDADAWRRVWDQLYAGQSPVPPLPDIDFQREMVVLAAMGTRDSGCYRVEVTAILIRGGSTLEIEVAEFEPAASCFCTQAVTQPVHVVRLERIAMNESFVVRQRQVAC